MEVEVEGQEAEEEAWTLTMSFLSIINVTYSTSVASGGDVAPPTFLLLFTFWPASVSSPSNV